MHLALDGRTPGRTPAEHSAAIAAAGNDDTPRRTRLGAGKQEFAPFLPALRTWRDLCQIPEPLTTNWLQRAANDNDEVDYYEGEWREPPLRHPLIASWSSARGRTR